MPTGPSAPKIAQLRNRVDGAELATFHRTLNLPQGPCHIKNTTVILIHYGVVAKQYDGIVQHYSRVSETPCFPGGGGGITRNLH